MNKLSVVIITYNEAHNIGRCLESVKNIADEIVVLDSFSTDNTPEICKQAGVKFYQHAFDGHIQQKNRAITYASFPFILSLDADEALDETLQQEVLRIKQNKQADAYELNRLTNYCGKWIWHCGWYPDRKLRLWDSTKGKWEGTNPHDKYTLQPGATTQRLKGNILHYSFYTVDEHYKQVEYFSTIAARAYAQEGKKSSLVSIYVAPVIKFIRDYIIKRGVLDGYAGFTISRISAYATYLKYKKLYELQKQANKGA